MRARFAAVVATALLACGMFLCGCSTAPKPRNQAEFLARAESTTEWFRQSVPGLPDQMSASAGYVIFPDVAQWGILFGGGTYGRGALMHPDGTQIGWAAINAGSIGLQAGVQGFRLLMVIEDQPTLNKFMANQLTGSVGGTAVVGERGASVTHFANGVAVYQGAAEGLMAGVRIGLDLIRYKPLDAEERE